MSNGYLIPENAQPADNRCLRVFVPDDPLYIAAFLGALTYFGQWTAWERDKEKRGQFAARAWQDANELTIDGLSLACGDYPLTEDEMSDILDKLDEISERLKELEDMDVIVNQTVNSGCGCGCDGETSTTNTVTTPIIDPTDTGIEPNYDDTVYAVADAVKCRTANWLADTIISVIRRLADIGTMEIVIVVVFGAIGQIVTMLDGIPLNGIFWGVVLITIAGAVVALSSLDDFELRELETLANEIESMKEELVCVLYGWTTSSELSSALLGFLYARIDETATAEGWDNDAVEFIRSIFDKLFGSRLSNHVVQNVGTIVPADFIAQYDCLCGATGDTCPTQNIVLAGLGNFPAGDLTSTTQGFASEFNSQTGYHEIIFELDANYCVTIENGAYTPAEAHEKCSDGVMVASDGSCIRRFVARSGDAFGTAVTFNSQTVDCSCQDWSCLDPSGEIFDGIVLTITDAQGDCTNYVADSFSMAGNRLTANLSVGYDPCWTDGFKITIQSVGDHVRGWMFDDVRLIGPRNAALGGTSLIAGGSGVNLYSSTNSLWYSCFESQGYSKVSSDLRLENDNVFQLSMVHAEQGETDTYTLQMTIRAINDLSL